MLKNGLYVVVIAIIVLWIFSEKQFPNDGALGKRVLITGASSGIGEQLAYEYAKHGASLFITARREDQLKKVVEKCKELGRPSAKFGYHVADMEKYITESRTFIDSGVKLLGGIDTVIVNHAFTSNDKIFWLGTDTDLKIFEKQVQINFNSYVYIVSRALPFLKDRKRANDGHIGIVGSIVGKLPTPSTAPYAGTKFALDGFFSSLRLELKQSKSPVTVTYGVIGGTDTDLMANNWARMERLNNSYMKMLEDMNNQFLVTPQSVAHQMMIATENGENELYYPKFTPIIPMPFQWTVVLRSVFSSFCIAFFPQDSYEAYEKLLGN